MINSGKEWDFIDKNKDNLEGWDFDMKELKKSEKTRQYRGNQGRSPRQEQSNQLIAAIAIVGLLLCFALLVINELILK